MSDLNVAPAGADAQQSAVANSIDTIIDSAAKEGEPSPDAVKEPEGSEPPTAEDELKKLRTRITKQDRRIGQLTAQKYQAFEELEKLRTGNATPQQEKQIVKDNKGVPTKLNQNEFQNYADYIEARAAEIADFKIDKKLTEFSSKQKETQQTAQEQAWEAERASTVEKMGEEFAKENPELPALLDEFADVIRDYPKELKHALLAADNPPLAFLNLAKDGKLEDLASMSLVDAKVEIRLAQMKQPVKPRTKAPTPLPASRGSVSSGKSLDSMSGDELLKWVKS